eukprot:11929262-Ditylum_brightwellii.AAC.1
MKGHLCNRLENLLPQNDVISNEVSTIKGELLLSRVANKASLSLSGLADVFTSVVKKTLEDVPPQPVGGVEVKAEGSHKMSDSASQQMLTMVHQTKFARIAIDAAADSLRLLSAGQWPELLSVETSAELGSAVVHPVTTLDGALSEQLRTLKQEGTLSPHRSSLTMLDQSVRSARLAIFSAVDSEGKPLLPNEWKPPTWNIFKEVSNARFSCFGAAAMIASVTVPAEDESLRPEYTPALLNLLEILDKVCTESTKVCHQLTGLDLHDRRAVLSVGEVSSEWKKQSDELFDAVAVMFADKTVNLEMVSDCEAKANETLRLQMKAASALRGANVEAEKERKFHPFSPEADDAWEGITDLVAQVQGLDGDEDDLNYLLRARSIEQQLYDSIENEPLLNVANEKVFNLEK